jgi:CheY-like chemotaxis protein
VRVAEHMTIGRADPERGIRPEVDLGPHNGYNLGVSRQHAAILTTGSNIRVKDSGSANGTRLNGCLLEPHHEYRLRHGDELAVGRLKLQVLFAVVPLVAEALAQAESTRIPLLGSGQRVLIVEDDADVAAVFAMILEQAGFKVLAVTSATSALEALAAEFPKAIVLDLMLPDMSGLDLVRYLRLSEIGGSVPVVVISGQTGGFQMSQALKAGADVFLGKPIGVDELIGAFTTILPQMAV